jgi:hypothetical protein
MASERRWEGGDKPWQATACSAQADADRWRLRRTAPAETCAAPGPINSGQKPHAGRYPPLAAAVAIAHTTRISRNACVRSATRPASGAEIRRIAVPAANSIPISSGGIPRASMKVGRTGEATANAEYSRAYRTMNPPRGAEKQSLASAISVIAIAVSFGAAESSLPFFLPCALQSAEGQLPDGQRRLTGPRPCRSD